MNSLAVSPKEDQIAISLSNGQLFLLAWKNKDKQGHQRALAAPALSFLHTPFHVGAICGEEAPTFWVYFLSEFPSWALIVINALSRRASFTARHYSRF